MRYRKKPVVIEAIEFTQPTMECPEWFTEAILDGVVYYQGGENPYYTIETLEGNMRVNIGDYIIRGVKGEIYPCKPDIFVMLYEPDTNGEMVQRADSAEVRTYWQPIETAPRDGRKVDLWTHLRERVPNAIWRDGGWKQWCLGGFDTMGYYPITGTATHWMPVPQPPAGEEG